MDRIQECVQILREALENNPNHAYLTLDGKHLCVLLSDNRVLILTGNYESMTEDDVNRLIVDALI